jgi:ABC-type multidrug transport system fused ATPase/permease subunit
VALLIRSLFDTHVPDGDTGAIVLAGAAILGLYVASTAVAVVARRPAIRAAKDTVTRMRGEILEGVQRLPNRELDLRGSADLHSLTVLDTEHVDRIITQLVTAVAPALIVSGALAGLALYMDPLLFGLLVLVMLPLMAAAHGFHRRSRHMGELYNGRLRTFARRVQHALRALGATRVHGAEPWALARQRQEAEALGEAGRRLAQAQSTQALVQNGLAAAAGVIVLVGGGIGVAEGRISIGDLFAFYAVVALLLRQVGRILPGLSTLPLGLDSLARIERFLSRREPQPYTGSQKLRPSARFALEGVGFGYGEHDVLRDVDLTVEIGDRVALVGPNGAGKSTIASLILGLYRPRAGRVTADGVPYDELDMRTLRASIGAALQDPVLMPGTIAENIAFGRDTDADAVREAARLATAAEFIERLPDGYATEAGEEGARLSGGERQKIAIARALVGRPPLILLDEPTTYLDDEAIDALMRNLDSLPWRPAVLVITHDAALARRADRVVVVRDGRAHEDAAAYASEARP